MPIKIPKKKSKPPAQLFIDRVVVTLELGAAAFAEDMHSKMLDALQKYSVFYGSKKTPTKVERQIALSSIEQVKHYPHMIYRFGGDKAQSLRLTLHPKDMGKQGFVELHDVLSDVLPGGWRYFIENAKITLIEISIDLHGVDFNNVNILPAGKQIYSAFQSGNKLTETIYLGKSRNNQIKVYNRGLKRAKLGQFQIAGTCTRVERTRKYTQLKLANLSSVQNPFNNLHFSSLPTAPPATEVKPYVWSLFLDSAAHRGLDPALKLLPPKKRTQYRAYLKKYEEPWWQPDTIWGKWPTVLAELGIIDVTQYKAHTAFLH